MSLLLPLYSVVIVLACVLTSYNKDIYVCMKLLTTDLPGVCAHPVVVSSTSVTAHRARFNIFAVYCADFATTSSPSDNELRRTTTSLMAYNIFTEFTEATRANDDTDALCLRIVCIVNSRLGVANVGYQKNPRCRPIPRIMYEYEFKPPRSAEHDSLTQALKLGWLQNYSIRLGLSMGVLVRTMSAHVSYKAKQSKTQQTRKYAYNNVRYKAKQSKVKNTRRPESLCPSNIRMQYNALS